MSDSSTLDALIHDDAGDPDQFYIRAPASRADDRSLVLKQGETFVVLDRHGDIRPVGLAEEGLYHEGTRYLTRYALRLGAQRPQLLSSAVKPDNTLITVDATNLDAEHDGIVVPRGTVHLARTIVLWEGALHERLRVHNFGASALTVVITWRFAADYADIFEVRGLQRAGRGTDLEPVVEAARVVLGYTGLDRVTRRTEVSFAPAPARVAAHGAEFRFALAPHAGAEAEVAVACDRGGRPRAFVAFDHAERGAAAAMASNVAEACGITTANQHLNEWLRRSAADLAMMTTETAQGPVPYAGVPWFSAPFGRDSLITAFECLWAMPSLAQGVLRYLAETQATETDPARDAQPGKILHEARTGEMAALGEIPFGRYYGSHDATPLFVMLAAAYFERTGDVDFVVNLWPHIRAALDWIERDGDADGDGLVEYLRQSPTGLVNQGWKDSHDAVFHHDGHMAEGSIALCEIQGYVCAAWEGAARLALLVQEDAYADDLRQRAARLREQIDRQFWCPDLGTYALALDGDKRPCAVVTSNPGHLLFTGCVRRDRAAQVARTLVGPESFSGWGVRTLAASEVRFNPMSYHNGSVWPHDNALIASGLSRYGLGVETLIILEGLYQASLHMDLHRLPELFCGFRQRAGEAPVQYPVACSPQAWAAASVYLLLQAALGLEIDAVQRQVRFHRPRLPAFLPHLEIQDLRVGGASLDLVLERHEDDVSLHVRRRSGHVEIVALR
jgi:glycogen debranching enzyme